ncbi:zinc-binding alcohol dehydrogenase family protein [Naasia lichenicola]|uniref:Zinc-binding alcohol dehydrogenase family protein n=1 Tax=Naasia lichenicola TaxID=2565933 RepID=A0A4S4FHH8_9MICO|nr:zinc-binding alcohol dehydrogenase family protein [Naasia lichenicola]THG29252.1 zinc-binding alcohol dehydrogenase family protein [Naasia lichenicola]
MPENSAAWLLAPRTRLTVGPAEMPRPAFGEVIVRVRAVAINPLDWIIQGTGQVTYRWLSGPTVLGTDVAGEVTAVGEGVARFRIGDRVVGLATGTDRGRDTRHEGGFQLYTALLEQLTAPLPDGMDYSSAAVLPLAVSTAACGLFQQQNLGLRLPESPTADGEPHERPAGPETVLIWGGSTSVGSAAVQLATEAGYRVISTASPRNFDFVRSLGAEAVFDYRGPSVIEDIRRHLGATPLRSALAVGAGSAGAALRLLDRGGRLAMASTPLSLEALAARKRLFPAMVPVFGRVGASMTGLMIRARVAGVRTSFIWGSSLRDDEVGPAIWRDYLPGALAAGGFLPRPEPMVVGDGLDAIQDAVVRLRAGVSAQKVVVTL